MPGKRTLKVSDVLDVRAAQAVSEAVAVLAAGESVIVDCRAVRRFEDRALALLAAALRGSAGSVALRGLGEHQWRVLGYLGVGTEAGTPASSTGEGA
jgi:anti-anti-sigma regulatory factor